MYNFYLTMEHADVTCVVACIKARTVREAWEIAGYPPEEFPMMVWKDRVVYIDIEFNVPPCMIEEFRR